MNFIGCEHWLNGFVERKTNWLIGYQMVIGKTDLLVAKNAPSAAKPLSSVAAEFPGRRSR
jgi:hypothetical protein